MGDSDQTQQPGIDQPEIEENPTPPFPVVGVGASAGGLEAFMQLLLHLPADTGMAFVFVQHLAPQHPSFLASILARSTAMPVMEARQNTSVEPNHVYVIPPNTLMQISHSVLELAVRPEERRAPRPIDHFFRSLAEDRKGQSIGVLLSGADADGALGLQAIREEGGIAIVQTEATAKSPEMPRMAITAGTVDLVLSPEEIGMELGRIARHPVLVGRDLKSIPGIETVAPDSPGAHGPLNRLFQLLRGATGVDFSGYKAGTVRRRIARRMLLQHRDNLASYLSSLESDRAELAALGEDMLIHVTSFFRDPDTFELFEKSILPELLKARADRADSVPVRVWVPGCSTGQEVYSIAMCLMEAMPAAGSPLAVQIFGTDVSERAIAAARNAVYQENEVAKLSPERQARFFVRFAGGFQIVKPLREICVFAKQNLLADPPFSRLNLISCRNLLIYLSQPMQRQVVSTFHYALQPEGYLWLGNSESLREYPELFSQIDKRHRLYRRKPAVDRLGLRMVRRGIATHSVPADLVTLPIRERPADAEIERAAERIVLAEFGPAWVLVNENFEILNSRGDVSPYLQLPPGRATLSLLRMARDEIRGELSKLLNRAKNGEFYIWSSVLSEETDGVINETRLEVRRVTTFSTKENPTGAIDPAADHALETCFVVVFFPGSNARPDPRRTGKEMIPDVATRGEQPAEQYSAEDVDRLRRELALANQRLQAIFSERDAANQELTSANEEIQSSNEELQSTNEELETSKEELQSSNEELNTVNEELQNRNHELIRLSDDLANLLSSTTIPILMLDNDLRIRRSTSSAERLFNIRQSDVGRPIGDIRLRLSEEDLDAMVRRVIDTLAGEEIELLDREGRWHLLRVRPYRTMDNRIEGAVLAMIDIDQMRRAQIAADLAREFAESLIESVQTPLLVLHRNLRVRMANKAFFTAYALRQTEVENRFLNELGNQQWNLPELNAALGRLSRGETVYEDLEIEQEASGSKKKIVGIDARRVFGEVERPADAIQKNDFQILLAANDLTAHRLAEKVMLDEQERLKHSVQSTAMELEQTESALHGSQDALQRSREDLRALTANLLNAQEEERRRVSRELHDDVGQNMAKLQFDIETLEQTLPPDLREPKERLLSIRDSASQLSNDLRRIAYALHPSTLDHLGLSVALSAYGREFSKRTGIPVKFTAAKVPKQVPSEVASSLYRITQEALRNVSKHARNGTVNVSLRGNSTHLTLVVRDNGPGFKPDAVRGNGGLGLISMEERARLIRGSFDIKTQPGKSTTITVSVPLT
jgi:two-component system CheB/CheR fusion protein